MLPAAGFMNMEKLEMRNWLSVPTAAIVMITALLLTAPSLFGQTRGAAAQGRGAAPPAGPFTRTAEGKPDLNGYWGGCCNLGLQDLETQRGVNVEPVNAKIPYNTEFAAKAKDLRASHMFDEPGLHCNLEGVPFQMYTQFGFQIVSNPRLTLITWDFMNANRVIPMDGRPHIPE